MMIRAKLPPTLKPYSERKLWGVRKCGKQCPGFPFVKEGKQIKGPNKIWNILEQIDCNTENIVYLIECNKTNFNQRYIGKTNISLRVRTSEPIGYENTRKLKRQQENISILESILCLILLQLQLKRWRKLTFYIEKKEKNSIKDNSTHTIID